MFGAGGKSSKVNIPKGKSTNDGRVSYSEGSKRGPAGSGAARNERLANKYGKK